MEKNEARKRGWESWGERDEDGFWYRGVREGNIWADTWRNSGSEPCVCLGEEHSRWREHKGKGSEVKTCPAYSRNQKRGGPCDWTGMTKEQSGRRSEKGGGEDRVVSGRNLVKLKAPAGILAFTLRGEFLVEKRCGQIWF